MRTPSTREMPPVMMAVSCPSLSPPLASLASSSFGVSGAGGWQRVETGEHKGRRSDEGEHQSGIGMTVWRWRFRSCSGGSWVVGSCRRLPDTVSGKTLNSVQRSTDAPSARCPPRPRPSQGSGGGRRSPCWVLKRGANRSVGIRESSLSVPEGQDRRDVISHCLPLLPLLPLAPDDPRITRSVLISERPRAWPHVTRAGAGVVDRQRPPQPRHCFRPGRWKATQVRPPVGGYDFLHKSSFPV